MNKKNALDKIVAKGEIKRFIDQKVAILIEGEEYILPLTILPSEAREGESLVLSVSKESFYKKEKEKTAKEILNEILGEDKS